MNNANFIDSNPNNQYNYLPSGITFPCLTLWNSNINFSNVSPTTDNINEVNGFFSGNNITTIPENTTNITEICKGNTSISPTNSNEIDHNSLKNNIFKVNLDQNDFNFMEFNPNANSQILENPKVNPTEWDNYWKCILNNTPNNANSNIVFTPLCGENTECDLESLQDGINLFTLTKEQYDQLGSRKIAGSCPNNNQSNCFIFIKFVIESSPNPRNYCTDLRNFNAPELELINTGNDQNITYQICSEKP